MKWRRERTQREEKTEEEQDKKEEEGGGYIAGAIELTKKYDGEEEEKDFTSVREGVPQSQQEEDEG